MNKTRDDYETRMIAEYRDLKSRYEKLHRMIVKADANTLEFELNCSLDLLKRQAKAMGEYLYVLEMRAECEGINLEGEED